MGKHAPQTRVDGAKLKADIKKAGYDLKYLSLESGHSYNYLTLSLARGTIATNTLKYICDIIDSIPEAYALTEAAQRAAERAEARRDGETAQKAAEATEALLVRIESQDALIKALQAEIERMAEKLKTIDGEIQMVVRRVYG